MQAKLVQHPEGEAHPKEALGEMAGSGQPGSGSAELESRGKKRKAQAEIEPYIGQELWKEFPQGLFKVVYGNHASIQQHSRAHHDCAQITVDRASAPLQGQMNEHLHE